MSSNTPHLHSLPMGAIRRRLTNGAEELVVAEAPLMLEVDGTRLLSMRTPQGRERDLEWALGFLVSEGVVQDTSEVRSMEWLPAQSGGEGNEVDEVRVALWRGSSMDRSGALSRTHEMRASCGLCGVESAKALVRGLRPLRTGQAPLAQAAIIGMVETLRTNQPLFDATGASHATAILGADGGLLCAREDIGRHNALDKTIGACVQRGQALHDAVAVLSGRAGYELVIKCLRAGIPTILSIGAASTFAIDLAIEAQATLVGFIRYGTPAKPIRMHVYHDAGRIQII